MALLNVNRILHNPKFSQKVALIKEIINEDDSGDQITDYAAPIYITAVVHPTGVNDLELLSSGEREFPSKKIFSQEPINLGDIFTYQGQSWRVVNLSNWSEYGFYNAIGILHEGTPSPTKTGFELR